MNDDGRLKPQLPRSPIDLDAMGWRADRTDSDDHVRRHAAQLGEALVTTEQEHPIEHLLPPRLVSVENPDDLAPRSIAVENADDGEALELEQGVQHDPGVAAGSQKQECCAWRHDSPRSFEHIERQCLSGHEIPPCAPTEERRFEHWREPVSRS